MKAAVSHPCRWRMVASVVCDAGSTKPPVLRTLWTVGYTPVIMLAWEGPVRGAGAEAFSKSTPCRARASRLGVSMRE